MKQTTRYGCKLGAIGLILALLWSFAGCKATAPDTPATTVTTTEVAAFTLEIINGERIELEVGSVFSLVTNTPTDQVDRLQWFSSMPYATVDEVGRVTAVAPGTTTITVYLGSASDSIVVEIKDSGSAPTLTDPATNPDRPTPDPGPSTTEKPSTEPAPDSKFTLTIPEVIAKASGMAHNTHTTEKYYVSGTVIEVYNTTYGNMRISDAAGNILTIYGSFSADGKIRYDEMAVQPQAGDSVTIYGVVGQFNDVAQIKNGWIVGHTPQSTTPDPDPPVGGDLPISPDRNKFYAGADPADSYQEALARSSRGELSGATTVPDQAPTISRYQPKKNGLLIRNSQPYYLDTNTYVVVDAYGAEVFRVYRGGGYITLEEVAAYVYAFGDVPANYVNSKNIDPQDSIWGEYLRLNHSAFSGDTSRYPYEPVLPDISGCGGDLYYYEIDIGTTGTDCDPGYYAAIYNNGYSITRGAARIVYTRYDRNRNNIIDPNEKFVFYTYNHYNDFQEYLNYYGGWGVMFGNITGGGTISSKYDYNPTPYVASVLAPLPQQTRGVTMLIWAPTVNDLYGKRRVA